MVETILDDIGNDSDTPPPMMMTVTMTMIPGLVMCLRSAWSRYLEVRFGELAMTVLVQVAVVRSTVRKSGQVKRRQIQSIF